MDKLILQLKNKYKLNLYHCNRLLYKKIVINHSEIFPALLNDFVNYYRKSLIDDEIFKKLVFINDRCFIDRVTKLEECIEQTYCLEMPKTHKFVQNGIFGWNCQGTGYKTVICIIDNTHYTLLDNCMLYTMLTRAKKRCLLLAEPKAFIRCIKTSHNERNTWLKLLTNV